MTIRESNVEQYLVAKMKEAGGLCYKFVSPGCDGVPDRICIYRGQVIFVELKRPGEVPRKLQRHRADELMKAGANVVCIDNKASVNILLKLLRKERIFSDVTRGTIL